MTLNVVLHRQNLGRIAEIIALAEGLQADRLELANTQYLAWALSNRAALLPSRAQLDSAREVAKAAKARLQGKIEVLFVLPDYYSDRPKACMSGWGKRYLLVSPDGLACPVISRTRYPGSSSTTCKTGRSTRFGTTRPRLPPSAVRLGCPSRARAATGATSTSEAAAAKPFTSRALQPPRIPRARYRRSMG